MQDQDHKYEEIARGMNLSLYARYSEEKVAQLLQMSVPTLKRLRGRGAIAYIRVSPRKISFFGYQIIDFLLDSVEQSAWQNTKNENSNSETTGFLSKSEARHGAELGTTRGLDRQSALALAQRTFKKPKNN